MKEEHISLHLSSVKETRKIVYTLSFVNPIVQLKCTFKDEVIRTRYVYCYLLTPSFSNVSRQCSEKRSPQFFFYRENIYAFMILIPYVSIRL